MNKALILFSIALVISAFICCKNKKEVQKTENNQTEVVVKKATLPPPPDPFASIANKLDGKWQWVKTICCGRTPKETSPSTVGYTTALGFANNRELTFYRNDSIQTKGKYKITFGLNNDESDTMIIIGDTPRYGYFRFKEDTLIVDYGYIDLQTEFYIKKK